MAKESKKIAKRPLKIYEIDNNVIDLHAYTAFHFRNTDNYLPLTLIEENGEEVYEITTIDAENISIEDLELLLSDICFATNLLEPENDNE